MRLLTTLALTLLLAAPASAETPAPSEADLDGAGKVIEVDPDGSSREVRGDGATDKGKAKKGDVTLAESCRLRLAAQCKLIRRCLGADGAGLPLPCESMAAGCGELQGHAPYTRKALLACVKGIESTRCSAGADPMDLASLQPEQRVPACREVMRAEAASGGEMPRVDPARARGATKDLNGFDIGAALAGDE